MVNELTRQIQLRFIDTATEAIENLANAVESCDSRAVGLALRAARSLELAFTEREIDNDELTRQLTRADILQAAFRDNCRCNKVERPPFRRRVF